MTPSPQASFRRALQRIVDLGTSASAEAADAAGQQLRDALLAFGSETPDNLACAAQIGLARIGNGAAWAMSIGDQGIELASLLHPAEGCAMP